MGLRVSAEVELEGLDIPEMGALAYPDFVLVPSTAMVSHPAMAVAPEVAPQGALKPVRG
jgi:Amt family ammonium transporter